MGLSVLESTHRNADKLKRRKIDINLAFINKKI